MKKNQFMKIKQWSALLVLCSCPLLANQKIDRLAEDLVEKRSQVDSLSTELELEKSELQNQMTALQSQRTDLLRQIKSEEMKLSETTRELGKIKEEIEKNKVPLGDLKPILMNMVEQLSNYVSKGLPFQKSERSSELNLLKEMLVSEKVSPEKAVSKIWSMLESEFRLSRENGMYRQTIEVDGDQHLAQVVKLGMTMMYFKISETKVGLAENNSGEWTFNVKNTPKEVEQINYLFDIFAKKIRTGYFEIPR